MLELKFRCNAWLGSYVHWFLILSLSNSLEKCYLSENRRISDVVGKGKALCVEKEDLMGIWRKQYKRLYA
jgi:hypothetical protein